MEINTEPGRVIMISSQALDDLKETNERLAKEIKRLEGLVEGRDGEIERLNQSWDEERHWREELQSLSIDQAVELGKLRAILGQLIDQWDPEGVRSSPDTKDPWRQAWWDARVALARSVP